MEKAISLSELKDVFYDSPVYIEVKVKSYGKPNKEAIHEFMRQRKNFRLDTELFITSMTSNELSNEEDTRYNTELKFTESIYKIQI